MSDIIAAKQFFSSIEKHMVHIPTLKSCRIDYAKNVPGLFLGNRDTIRNQMITLAYRLLPKEEHLFFSTAYKAEKLCFLFECTPLKKIDQDPYYETFEFRVLNDMVSQGGGLKLKACFPVQTINPEDIDQFPCLDWKALVRELDSSVAAEKILGDYCRHVSAQLKSLSSLHKEEEYSKIQEVAHAIKGGAANIRATRLRVAAFLLEEASTEKDCVLLDQRIRLLSYVFDVLIEKQQWRGLNEKSSLCGR